MTFKLLEIVIITSLIIDVTGFIDSIKYALSKPLHCEPHQIRLKPFDCSLCASFWTGLIYLFANSAFNLTNLTVLLIMVCFSTLVSELFYTIKHIIIKILAWITKQF